jgi:hypothetical protein
LTGKNNMERVARAIARNRVPLTLNDKFWFWLNPVLVIGLAGFLFYRNEIADRPSLFGGEWRFIDAPGFHMVLFILAGIGGFMVLKNFRLFKLTAYPDNRPASEKRKIAARMGGHGWKVVEEDAGMIRFWSPRMGARSPQIVTILFDQDGYYLNCLDARKKTLDWGSGRKVVAEIVEKIRAAKPA